MAYDAVRVLRYKGYLDYTNWKIDGLKEYAGEPRKWEIHNQDLFELWVERAEILKKAREDTKRGQKPNTDNFPSKDDPQIVLTREFLNYYKMSQREEYDAFFYELCMGRPISRSRKKPMLYNAKEQPMQSSHTMFELQIGSLYSLINMVEWIVGGFAI